MPAEKYQELAFEIRRLHGASKVTVIIPIRNWCSWKPGVTWCGKLCVTGSLESVQLLAILGTALTREVWDGCIFDMP